MKRRSLALVVAALCLWLAGCGGGGGGGGEVTPRATIQWGQRSRTTSAPGSALSARVRVQPVGGSAQDILIERRAAPAAYSESVGGSQSVSPGMADVTVTFYAQSGQAGDIVAQGSAQVTVGSDGILPDIAAAGRVASVDIPTGQQTVIGTPQDLVFTARTSGGALLALTPGSSFWSVVTGSDRLAFVDARAQGQLPGIAAVSVMVDGVNSGVVSVKVTSNASVTVTPGAPRISVGGTQTFTATVAGTNGGTQGVTWSVQEGAAGGLITGVGAYTAPATPGTYHVVATSVYDPDKSGVATVTVVAGGVDVGGDFPGSGGVGVDID